MTACSSGWDVSQPGGNTVTAIGVWLALIIAVQSKVATAQPKTLEGNGIMRLETLWNCNKTILAHISAEIMQIGQTADQLRRSAEGSYQADVPLFKLDMCRSSA